MIDALDTAVGAWIVRASGVLANAEALVDDVGEYIAKPVGSHCRCAAHSFPSSSLPHPKPKPTPPTMVLSFSFTDHQRLRQAFAKPCRPCHLLPRVYAPMSVRPWVLHTCHTITHYHLGISRTLGTILHRVWWIDMDTSKRPWLRRCVKRQARKTSH